MFRSDNGIKRKRTLFVLLLLILSALSYSALILGNDDPSIRIDGAEPADAGEVNYKFTADGMEYMITSTSPNEVKLTKGINISNVEIPSSVSNSDTGESVTYSVTSIGNLAFYNYSTTSVTIPNSVTALDENAFRGSALTSVAMPDSVKTIGSFAFYYCRYLATVDLGSVSVIGDYAFRGTALTSVTIPDSVTIINMYTFAGCSELTTVDIANVSSIVEHAFDGCTKLTSIDLSSVTLIGNRVFQYCIGLTSVDLSSVESIGVEAFNGCHNLRVAIFSSPNADIKAGAFPVNTTLVQTNLENMNASAEVDDDGNMVFTLTAGKGYKLPGSVTVKVGGIELTPGTDYTYDKATGKVVVQSQNVTDQMEITATADVQTSATLVLMMVAAIVTIVVLACLYFFAFKE